MRHKAGSLTIYVLANLIFDNSSKNIPINDKIHPFAHIPFGGGPRVCIGQNMARMQILLVISAVIRKYDIELCSNREVGHHAMMLLKPDGPIYMEFTKVRS